MPNSFAYLMLIAWPGFAVALFRLLPFERALIWSILGAYLLLPQNTYFNLPMIPALNKVSIPNLAAVACCLLLCGKRLRFRPVSLLAGLLVLLSIVSPFGTVMTNGEPADFGNFVIPGLQTHDAFSMVANQLVFILPLFLARQFLATEAAQREILLALMVGGLIYSVPMLIEVRLSPQLHTWIYGFFQHGFEQAVRGGGFRPYVFLPHGLWVAFFAMMAFVATVSLWRMAEPNWRLSIFFAAVYLAIVLILCKSLGSLIFAAMLVPLVAFAGRKLQIYIAALLAVLALSYPALRGADLVPVEWMTDQAAEVEEDRAESLAFRLENEALLLGRAAEKPLFGWGSWGRNHLYSPWTPGRAVTVTDGRWIIVIGVSGWLGYIAEFGLLTLPLLLVAWRVRRLASHQVPAATGTLCLLLAISLVDLIPNSTLIPFTWLICGALLGYAERPVHSEVSQRPDTRGPVSASIRCVIGSPSKDAAAGRSVL
jgi:hypothetical protein